MNDVESHVYKYRKSEVGYEHPAKGKDHCSTCEHFIATKRICGIVAGVIEPKDWCKKWKPI